MLQLQRTWRGIEPSAPAVGVPAPLSTNYQFPHHSTYWSRGKSSDQTSPAWHCHSDCLWQRGIFRRLWCCRLINAWPKMAELPYQVSSRRKRKEAVSRLAKQQRYHMITVASGYTSRPFSRPFHGAFEGCIYARFSKQDTNQSYSYRQATG